MNNELQHKIDIILNEEKRAYQANGRRGGGLGSFNIDVGSGWTTQGQIPKLVSIPASTEAIQSPNSTLLLKLYASLSSEQKKDFQEILLSYLSRNKEYFSVAYLIFFVLYKIGQTVEAIKQARINLKGDSDFGFSNMLALLSKIVFFEHSYIGQDLLDEIKNSMDGEAEHNFQLFERINSAEVELLKIELSDINPEINKDREKIINLWAEKFGSKEIPSVIDEIEENFVSGDFTATKFATCVGRVRVLLVEFLRKIAAEISQSDPKKKIDDTTEEYAVFDYLRTQKFLTDDEWNIVRALYGLTSDKGAHTVISLKEYARLTKNMAYEVLLLSLSKYEQR